jgi:DNA-binding LytR/AlgR family response regulator
MNVLIIEDEAPAFRRLQKCLEELDEEIDIIDVLDSVEESVNWLRKHPHPDLIFMDIQLSDGLSFEIFESIPIRKPVIFTTAFDEYMLRAFKVNSVDYLLKPIKKEELAKSLEKYHELKYIFGKEESVKLHALIRNIRPEENHYRSRILVKKNDQLISVETQDILCFQVRLGVVHLLTRDGRTFLMDQSLDELAQQLHPGRFFRVNRQYIIHFPCIEEVHKYHKGKLLVKLSRDTGEPIVISAEKSADFKGWLDN